jgi:hypothetical protein
MSALPPVPTPPSTPSATQTAAPLRIRRLTLTDFRAFPGPAPARFDLDGRSLLVYGENGTGKSSIFYALSDFFSLRRGKDLRTYKNVFSGEPETSCSVEVEFSDGAPAARWFLQSTAGAIGTASIGSHPVGGSSPALERHPATALGGNDGRVTQAALRRASLDYRALLDTNYKQGDSAINLFDIALERLLTDFPVTIAGGTTRTVGDLWRAVEQAKPVRHTKTALTKVNQACTDFNHGFNQALAALHPLVGVLLGDLIGADVAVAPFSFGGITYTAAYYKRDREIAGRSLTLGVSYRSHPLSVPQHFLNEARLSALALAIYLAGRLACVPTTTTTALKLLVLDDVLIGLDHSNRLPVLDVLSARFADWQIILLTHDRVWFEMARFHLGNSGHWKCLEIFEGEDSARGIPSPTVRASGENAAKTSLAQARIFLADHHIPAAANYTRAAFELSLKSFCERFGVPVAFKTDPRHLDTEKLLSAIEAWLKSHSAKGCMAGVIERTKLFRKVVLNPYSHSAPPNIARAEVDGAISAVDNLLEVIGMGGMEGSPIRAAKELIVKEAPSLGDMQAALGYLRVAFFESLRAFCERKHVDIVFRNQSIDVQTLWHAVLGQQATLFLSPHNAVPTQIDAERGWLVLPITETDLAALTQADLARLVTLLVPAGNDRLMLDRL